MQILLKLPEAKSRIDWRVFIVALILAPIVTAAALFFLIVPLFAVPFGAVPYLVFGAPAYWLVLRRLEDPTNCIGPLVFAGLVANLGSVVFFTLYVLFEDRRMDFDTIAMLSAFGFVFAGLWSLVFGGIYSAVATRHVPFTRAEIFA